MRVPRPNLPHRCLAVFLITAAWPAGAVAQQAEIGAYHQSRFTKQGGKSTVLSYDYLQGDAYLTETVGIWGFLYHESNYFSGVAGLSVDLSDWLTVGLGAGPERMRDSLTRKTRTNSRWAVTAWLGSDQFHVEGNYEGGGSRQSWYQMDAMWQPTLRLGLGVLWQDSAGVGPRVVVRPFKDVPLELWAAPVMYDFASSHSNAMAGVQFVLRKQ